MHSEINENLITAVIAGYSGLSQRISREIGNILNARNETDENELIVAASMPGKSNEPSHSKNKHDLYDVFERYERMKQGQEKNINGQLIRLIEEQETIDRIYAAYVALPWKYREVLYNLYGNENNIVEQGIYDLCKKFDKERTAILRWRKKAMNIIKELYNSDSSNLDFFKVVENINYR